MTTPSINVIESEDVERDYGFDGTIAIIDHPEHGRLLIQDGYAEHDICGGCVRWSHGIAIRIMADDTLDGLRDQAWSESMDLLDAVKSGCDESRPVLLWTGAMVASVAKAAGLR